MLDSVVNGPCVPASCRHHRTLWRSVFQDRNGVQFFQEEEQKDLTGKKVSMANQHDLVLYDLVAECQKGQWGAQKR